MNPKDTPQIKWQGRHLTLKTSGRWEYVTRHNISGIVGIIPITKDNKLVLVEQFRPPVGTSVIEIPAGLAGDKPEFNDEEIATAAERELLEETGYQAGKMELLFVAVSTPGLTDETVHYYLATNLSKVHQGGGDSSEDITVHEIELDSFERWVKEREDAGLLVDVKAYTAIYYLRNRFG